MTIKTSAHLATTMMVFSCGTAPPRPLPRHAPPPTGQSASPASSVVRFRETLQKGGSLYGLGVGCDEWRAEPSNDPNEPGGDLSARLAHQGRMYGFSYDLTEEHDAFRLLIAGRGSWSPAPGATVPVDENGYGLIGVGNYCVEHVDVRASPLTGDAVLVGDETWFMTKEACSKHRHAPDVLRCSAKGKRTPP